MSNQCRNHCWLSTFTTFSCLCHHVTAKIQGNEPGSLVVFSPVLQNGCVDQQRTSHIPRNDSFLRIPTHGPNRFPTSGDAPGELLYSVALVQVTEAMHLGLGLPNGLIQHGAATMIAPSVDIKLVSRGQQRGAMRHDDVDAAPGDRLSGPRAKSVFVWAVRKCVAIELGRVGRGVNGEGPVTTYIEYVGALF